MIELIIRNEIKVESNPINTYELVVTGMSGDGDHDEKNSALGDHDFIVQHVALLNAVSEMDWNARCDETPIYPVLEAKAEELGMGSERAKYWYDDMVGPDLTYDGRRAMLVGVEVFWWDEHGRKFEVEVKGLINPMN